MTKLLVPPARVLLNSLGLNWRIRGVVATRLLVAGDCACSETLGWTFPAERFHDRWLSWLRPARGATPEAGCSTGSAHTAVRGRVSPSRRFIGQGGRYLRPSAARESLLPWDSYMYSTPSWAHSRGSGGAERSSSITGANSGCWCSRIRCKGVDATPVGGRAGPCAAD